MAKKAAVAVPVQEDRQQSVADLSAALIAEMNKNSKPAAAVPSTDRKTSSRATWKGLLSVGALTFAVKTYTGTEEDKVEFHMHHSAECTGRLKETGFLKCEQCSSDVHKSEATYFTDYNGKLVPMTKDEKEACQVSNDGVLSVLQFAKLSDVDPMYFESTDFVAPGGEKKADKAVAAKAFGLLRLAMVETQTVAIAKRVKSGRDQIVALRPYGLNGIVMQHLFFENEIRLFNGWNEVPVEVDAPMVSAAVGLVNAMTEDFDPTSYGDSYLTNLRAAVASKATDAVAPTFTKDAAPSGSTDDLMATLMASVAAAQAKPKRKAS